MNDLNKFCYALDMDIQLEDKASDRNSMCTGCSFLMMCQRDMGMEPLSVDGNEKVVKSKDRVKKKSKSKIRNIEKSDRFEQISFDSILDDVDEKSDNGGHSPIIEDTSRVMSDDIDLTDDVDLSMDYISDDFFGEDVAFIEDVVTVETPVRKVPNIEISEFEKLVVETEWLDSTEKIDSVTYYGIDLSEDLPYFTPEELVKLGRFASPGWI